MLEPEQRDHLVGAAAEPGIGPREQACAGAAQKLLAGRDQVVAHGEAAENLQALEGAADAAAREAQWRQAGDILALETHVTRGRLDLAENGVEQRGLAAAVRADDAEDLPGSDIEADAVDGLDRAIGFPDVGDFEERAHRRASRSGSESRPPGSQTIITTIDRPNIARYQSAAKRSHSGSSTTMTAPIAGPKKRPDPPTMTMSSIDNEIVTLNDAGSMKPTSGANRAPAIPAKAAPIAKAISV